MAKKTKCVCDICKTEYDSCLNFEFTIKGDLSKITRFGLGNMRYLQSLFKKGVNLDLCPNCAAQPIAAIIGMCDSHAKLALYPKTICKYPDSDKD